MSICGDCKHYDYCSNYLCNHHDQFFVGDEKPVCCKQGGECKNCNYLKYVSSQKETIAN